MTPILLSTPLSSLSSILFSTPWFSIKQRLASTPATMLKEERKKAILKFTHPEEGWNLLYTLEYVRGGGGGRLIASARRRTPIEGVDIELE